MRLSARIAVIIALVAGLGSAPVSAGADPAPVTRFRPATLALGAQPSIAWHSNYPDYEFHAGSMDPVPLRGADERTPYGLHRAHGGWLLDYYGKGRGVELLDEDGAMRRLGMAFVQVVAAEGRSYVTATQGPRRRSWLLRQVRVSDGQELARHRLVTGPGSGSIEALEMASGRVLLEQRQYVGSPGDGRGSRYTTMWWTPGTGKVTGLWRTQHKLEVPPPAASIAGQVMTVRDGSVGQTVRDLRTRRPLWRLPAGETGVSFSPPGSVLVTVTGGLSNQVRTLRARDARSGRLLSAFRGIVEAPFVRAWESRRVFVVYAGNRVKQDDDSLRGTALVRCSVRTAACERVDAPSSATLVERQGSSTGY